MVMIKHLIFPLLLAASGFLTSQNDSIPVAKKWQLHAGFTIGANIFTKDLKADYTNQLAGGVFFDFYFKKAFLSLRDHIGFGLTNREFRDTTIILPDKSHFRSVLFEADLGLVGYENQKIRLTPFAGLSSFFTVQPIFKKPSTPYSINFGIPFTTTWSFGFNFDYKYKKAGWRMKKGERIKVVENKFIRIRNAFFFPQLRKPFQGNIYCVTIDFGSD